MDARVIYIYPILIIVLFYHTIPIKSHKNLMYSLFSLFIFNLFNKKSLYCAFIHINH